MPAIYRKKILNRKMGIFNKVLAVMARIFSNRNFIFILAFVLGFAAGNIGDWLRYLVLPALGIVMTVSMLEIPNRSFLPLRDAVKPSVVIFLLNYVIFSIVTLVPAYFFIEDAELWKGFVIAAASPAGVAIAPFTGILGGNKAFSLKGVIASHLMAVLIIPFYGWLFIGSSFIQPVRLLILFSELILAPFVVSRLILKFRAEKNILRRRGIITNWGLFVVIFTVIALNRSYFLSYPGTVGVVSAITAAAVLVTGLVAELILKKTGIGAKNRSSYILFATIKNGGFAAAAALSLSGERASLPPAIISVFIIIYLIYLSLRAGSFRKDAGASLSVPAENQ